MSIHEILEKLTAGEVAGVVSVVLIVLISLIQISPIKLNPWDAIFDWIGKKISGTVDGQTEELKKEIVDLKKQVCDLWINAHRQNIMTFSRECRTGISHDVEKWSHILMVADEYETYCKEHTVSDGVVKADTAYIKDLYQQLCRNHEI